MTQLLAIQLLLSFVIGGCYIAFLSLLAERAHESISGMILMVPGTMVLGFFFLGWITSAAQVAQVVPATLIPLGVVIFSSVIYIFYAQLFAKYIRSKKQQILATFMASTITWFILAAPFAIVKFTSLYYGIAGYALLVILAHYILNRNPLTEPIERMRYTKMQITFRAAFIGCILVCVVLASKLLGAFWGGVFTMYPAASFAALMLFHNYYEPRHLVHFMKKAPLGSLSLLIYGLAVMYLYPRYGLGWGTFYSYLIALAYSLSLMLYKLQLAKRTELIQ